MNILHIYDEELLIAMILRDGPIEEGTHFITKENLSQQVGLLNIKKGHIIQSHFHNYETRQVHNTQEVLIIKSGEMRVDFYSISNNYIESTMVYQNDVLILIQGGHGFKVIKDVTMIEVKQGPYLGELDKTHFASIQEKHIKLKE